MFLACLLSVSSNLSLCDVNQTTTVASSAPTVNWAPNQATTSAPAASDELDSTTTTSDVLASRTTVKKELQPTEATTTAFSVAPSGRPVEAANEPRQQQQQPEEAARNAEDAAKIGELVGSLGGEINQAMSAATNQEPKEDEGVPENLLPGGASLFDKDAVDLQALAQMDCHLRNVDYCVAGIMGSASKLLPETDAEFEVRCDEMKATTTCLAAYNKRCSTFKVFAALAPFANGNSPALASVQSQEALKSARLPEQAESLLMNSNKTGRIAMADLMGACEPEEKRTPTNKLVRARLFTLSKCINTRIPKLRPCLEDLKVALQLFYEPSRSLPLRPTCCALSRFRHCSSQAMDRVCGLSSFDQLLGQLTSGGGSSGPFSMVKSIELVCRQSASDFRSAYCADVLPASGLRGPQRRGRKASKLAKALDLISFAPAAQEVSFS